MDAVPNRRAMQARMDHQSQYLPAEQLATYIAMKGTKRKMELLEVFMKNECKLAAAFDIWQTRQQVAC